MSLEKYHRKIAPLLISSIHVISHVNLKLLCSSWVVPSMVLLVHTRVSSLDGGDSGGHNLLAFPGRVLPAGAPRTPNPHGSCSCTHTLQSSTSPMLWRCPYPRMKPVTLRVVRAARARGNIENKIDRNSNKLIQTRPIVLIHFLGTRDRASGSKIGVN